MTTTKSMIQRAAELKAELAKLQDLIPEAKAANKVSVKIGAKGQLVIYGLGRFPVNLYLSQLNRLNEAMPVITQFAKENEKDLAVKATE